MIISKEQQEELKEAAKPLVKFLCDNFHPHVMVVVEPHNIELLEGVSSTPVEEFIKD